ncbi:hypothetical protein CCP4SC76_510003 [Gammaproteobacteria bacterium]
MIAVLMRISIIKFIQLFAVSEMLVCVSVFSSQCMTMPCDLAALDLQLYFKSVIGIANPLEACIKTSEVCLLTAGGIISGNNPRELSISKSDIKPESEIYSPLIGIIQLTDPDINACLVAILAYKSSWNFAAWRIENNISVSIEEFAKSPSLSSAVTPPDLILNMLASYNSSIDISRSDTRHIQHSHGLKL